MSSSTENENPTGAENEDGYEDRVRSELHYFQEGLGTLALPDAHHYWSNKYLRPEVERVYGVSGPIETYVVDCVAAFRSTGSHRILSVGCGRGENEIQIARRLLSEGFDDVRIDCMDLAPRLCDAGRALAEAEGVGEHIRFVEEDMNTWRADEEASYSVIIANEILHHICELEWFFQSARSALAPGGKLLTRDMIGRNGHVCWPEAKAVVDQIWEHMPERYRYDHIFKRRFDQYPNRDCSTEGFEGIRSQDVLELLLENFHFERFVAYGGVIERFTGRAFGHNLDLKAHEGDRVFVDMVYLLNQSLISAGAIKPTQAIATLTREPCPETVSGYGFTPEFCLRKTSP